MSVPIDITDFSREDLLQLVIAFQQRIVVQSQYMEVMQAKITGLSAENESLRNLLAERIVGVMVHPTLKTTTIEEIIQNAKMEEVERAEEAEEKTEDDVSDMNDKDKFQA